MLGIRSQRDTIASLEGALAQASDALVIAGANAHDRGCILRRREHDLQDDSVRTCVLRRLDRLGYLCEDITDTYVKSVLAAAPHEDTLAPAALQVEWSALLRGEETAMSSATVAFLEEVASRLREVHSAMRAAEGTDSDVSSVSDYSDADTESTATMRSTSSASSDGEEEEEEA